MAQISKKYLIKDRLNKIFQMFFYLIIKIKNKKDANIILSELLTSTEKIMIAKRVACFYLLCKKVTIRDISDILKLSTSTVFYYRQLYKNKEKLKEYLHKKIFKEKIKETVKDIFMEFYYNAPRKGSDWSTNKKIYYKYQLEKEDNL